MLIKKLPRVICEDVDFLWFPFNFLVKRFLFFHFVKVILRKCN